MTPSGAAYPSGTFYPAESLYPSSGTGINRVRVNERPPMRQYILATAPSGKTRRWGEDESDPADVLEDFTDSDSAPGGNKELTGTLPRKPGIDYADMKMGTKLEVFGAGQYKVSEYRLERTPRTSGNYLVMDPAANGYQVLLTDDEGAQALIIDADLSGWGEPSPQRRLAMSTGGFRPSSASTSVGAQPTGSAIPALIFDFTSATSTGAAPWQGAEMWNYAGGADIASIMFDQIGDATTPWDKAVGLSNSDVTPVGTYDISGNYSGQAENVAQVLNGSAGRRYAFIQVWYVGPFVGQMTNIQRFPNVKLIGTLQVELHGAWPEIGVLASDVIAYLLPRFAGGLHFTTGSYGSIKPSSFLIPHLTFKEPTTVQEMITQTLRFELLEWGVWPGQFGPTFYLNPRGQREGRKRWRARVRPAKLTETGQQMDQNYNRVVVSWSDIDGTQKVVGPIGSGLPYEDSRCEDLDPLNPINESGEARTKHLTMNGPATVNGSAEVARLFLEKVGLLDGSGEATLTGYVEDEHGIEWPYYCVHAADEIEFIDSSISGYRYIVEATRNRKSRSVNIKIDAPPDSYEAILAELQVRETAAGIS